MKRNLRLPTMGRSTLRTLAALCLAALLAIPWFGLAGAAGAVTLVHPVNGSVIASSTEAFIADVADDDGLASATRYVGEVQQLTWSGAEEVDDAQITADTPGANAGTSGEINVDELSPHAHALIRFNRLTDIPPDARVLSATLQLNCYDAGNLMTAYRLIENWDESTVTWIQRASGADWPVAGADGSSHVDPGVPANCTATGLRLIDITLMVQDWVDGEPNCGLVLVDGGTDGVDFYTSEDELGRGPVLVVEFVTLAPIDSVVDLSGPSASVDFGPITGLVNGRTYAWDYALVDALAEVTWAPAPATFLYDVGYPEIPVLVAPDDGATGVPTPPTLEVTVSDPDGDAMDVTFYGRPLVSTGEPFTIVALPDTQFYSASHPETFTAQTQWIADNRAALNIVFVTHEGDIVDTWNNTTQWGRAQDSLSLLAGVGIPLGLAPGNHDQEGYTGSSDYYNQTFFNLGISQTMLEAFADPARPTDLYDNNAHLFSAGGVDFLILQLEYAPSGAVLAWANGLIQAYSDRMVIITTHSYLNTDASLLQPAIWDTVIAPNPNVYLVLCGHMHGEARRTDLAGAPGQEHQVHQVLADYQALAKGGNGYLRILRFVPAEDKVYVQTYSPTLNAYQTDADSEFVLDLPMNWLKELDTVAGVPSGGNASFMWSGLEPGQTYEWAALATDITGRRSLSPTWSFTTTSDDTIAPVISDLQVVGITDTSATITWATDEPATSLVTLDGGPQQGDSSYVTEHTVTFTGLTPSTIYPFQVSSADNAGNSASSTGEFTTLAPNFPPEAHEQDVTTPEDTALGITLTATDTDDLIYSITLAPQHGTLSGTAPSLTYMPEPDYVGPDSFEFTVDDSRGGTDTALVSITVTAVNDPPIAPAGLAAIAGDSQVLLNWQASTDPDSASLVYEVYRSTSSGIYGEPYIGLTDLTSFTDDTVVNGTTYYYVVRCLDDSVPEPLWAESAEVSATPAEVDPNAYVIQDPTMVNGTWSGDSYTSLQSTGDGGQSLSEAKIGVFGRLDAQYVLQTPVDIATINADITLVLDASFASAPDDFDWQVYAWNGSAWSGVGNLTEGLAQGQPATLTLTVNLAPGTYVAPDGTIQIAITDGGDRKKETMDSITIDRLYALVPTGEPNIPPVAESQTGDDTVVTEEDASVGITLEATDADGGPQTLTYRVTSGPSYGTLSGTAPDLIYLPNPDYNGADTFTFVANDGLQDSNPATVDITVTAVNDAPVAESQSLTTDLNTSIVITLASDVDGDSLTYSIDSGPSNGTLSPIVNNQVTYTPNLGYLGSDDFTFTVDDGNSGTSSATVTIEVTEPSAASQIHVGGLVMSLTAAGKNSKGTATVTIVDQNGNPVSGATVTGSWTFQSAAIGSSTGLTGVDGVVVLTSVPIKASSGSVFTFTVTDVALAGAEYDPSRNVLSNGSVVVP